MEVIWVLLLTVCSNTGCISQEVLEEKTEQDCHYQRVSHDTMPSDGCLLYTSPSPRDYAASRMPSSA